MNSRSSDDWVWLELETVLAVHDEQIAEHGGGIGVRDTGLLESALARPVNLAAYGRPDAAELAAVYAIAIARNHPFVDGNKRTAFVALELFLDQNGVDFAASDADAALMTWRLAAGDVSDDEFIAWVRQYVRALDARAPTAHIPHMPSLDAFVHPEEPTATEAIAAIGDELGVFDDWMDRYQYIIELGKKLPPFPEEWANDAHRVPGCQSRVWMEAARAEGKLWFAAVSDAAIVSGLIALLLRVYSGRSSDEVAATDPVFLKDLGLLEALSTNRGNGIAAMARKVREVAALEGARATVG